jgi:septum formation protein
LLERAGLSLTVDPARIDEADIRAGLDAEGASARAVAEALAEFKARKISARHPGALVIGADQVAELDGSRLDKPADMASARDQLTRLQGKTHRLHSAAVVVRDGAPIWRHIAAVQMTMRPMDGTVIDAYLGLAGPQVLGCVGCYQFEGLGASLFAAYRGDYFAVLGLPLLEVLDVLRANGAIR